jgi:TPR repeat protein
MDLNEAAHHFKLAVDQGNAEAKYYYAICLICADAVHRYLPDTFRYLKLSAENGSQHGQFVVACMAEHGIGVFSSANVLTAIQYYERCSDSFPAGSACFGSCLQTGKGIPVDFTVAAEFFKEAADLDNPDGINNFGCYLERGEGVDPDIELALTILLKSGITFTSRWFV